MNASDASATDAQPMPADLVVVDLGNTRTRLALYRGDALCDRGEVLTRADDWTDRTADALARLRADAPDVGLVIGSVVPARGDALERLANEAGVAPVLRLRPARHRILPHRLETVATTGIDRLAAARAAWDRIGGAAVVVDAGTAVTVDLVDAAGVFCGGAIFPGADLLARTLHGGTAQLPDLAAPPRTRGPDAAAGAERAGRGGVGDSAAPPPESAPGPHERSAAAGQSTVEAIESGVRYGLAGAVSRLVAEHAQATGAQTPVFLTGGGADALEWLLPFRVVRAPDLVLDGLRAAAQTIGRSGP